MNIRRLIAFQPLALDMSVLWSKGTIVLMMPAAQSPAPHIEPTTCGIERHIGCSQLQLVGRRTRALMAFPCTPRLVRLIGNSSFSPSIGTQGGNAVWRARIQALALIA